MRPVCLTLSSKLIGAFSSDLLDYLSYQTHRGKESFDTHVWMLKTLLRPSAEDFPPFHLYVMAICFPKMIRRMKKPFSVIYMACLQKLDTFPFIQTAQNYSNDQPDQERDRLFICSMPSFVKAARHPIPNLERAAKQQPPVGIYNKDTYMEFHLLLCSLLQDFRDSLTDLVNLQATLKRDLETILKALKKVTIYGTLLMTMVRSSAIETHLRGIEHLLEVDPRKLWTPSEVGAEVDTDDADFQRLKPFSTRKGKPLSPWQSYRDWLQLMVHYFDSATILTTYIQQFNPPPTIAITILTPPATDKRMLPWTELLKTEHFSRTETPGEKFIEDLEGICQTYVPMKNDINNLAKSAKAEEGLESLSAHVRARATAMMEKYKTDDQRTVIQRIVELAEKPDIKSIVEGLNVLSNSATFYAALQKGSLCQDNGFKGRLHCEAYVASLLAFFGNSQEYTAHFEKRLEMLYGHQARQMHALLDQLRASCFSCIA
jgi:hypothetical protein